jgi:UDP-2,3-diacylglucosamine hydrolase
MPAVQAPTPAFFFSDVHLGFDTPEAERKKQERLLRFLEMVRASGGSLFCLGDLFDFWFEYESTVPRRYFAVLRRLQELSESGVKLYFIGGNHDYWVRRNRGPGFLEQEIGFAVLADGAEILVGGLRLLLFHGDGLGRQDLGYRLLKRVLRNRLAIETFRWVHPDLARRIGRLTSRVSRRGEGGAPREKTCTRVRDHAAGILRARPDLDAVIAGHAHRPEETPVGRARYLNLGDWIGHASYAVVEDGRLSLRLFQPTAETAPPFLLA